MNYTLIKKEQNVGGDWSVAIDVNGTILHLLYADEPTANIISSSAQNFIDTPSEELTDEESIDIE